MAKLDIFKQFAVDESKETEGAWISLTPETKLLVARAGNRNYARLLAKLVEQHRSQIDSNDEAVSEEVTEMIMTEVMAKSILLGWEGVLYKGEELPYSPETAKQLLALKDFRKQVAQFADNFDNYRAQSEEATVKNS